MPEVVLCCECKQPINKTTNDYVVIKKSMDAYPEVLIHVACEQKRGSHRARAIFDDFLESILRWPKRS